MLNLRLYDPMHATYLGKVTLGPRGAYRYSDGMNEAGANLVAVVGTKRLTQADGEAWMRAMPLCYTGGALACVLYDDDTILVPSGGN